MGWNGMVGDIAEGLADFAIGPFTISAARSEVITFSIGWIEYVKTFFLSTKTDKAFNFNLYLKPLRNETWIAVILTMIIAGFVLRYIVSAVKDKKIAEFSLRQCFTFSISGISFVRAFGSSISF